MPTSLPARANLKFLKKQSKDLHKAFAAGETQALQRIHDHLPRARQLDGDGLQALDLSLQEAQHALACEYGFTKWEELLVAGTLLPRPGMPSIRPSASPGGSSGNPSPAFSSIRTRFAG